MVQLIIEHWFSLCRTFNY